MSCLLQGGKIASHGLFLQTGEALGGGVGLLFQIAQLLFGCSSPISLRGFRLFKAK